MISQVKLAVADPLQYDVDVRFLDVPATLLVQMVLTVEVLVRLTYLPATHVQPSTACSGFSLIFEITGLNSMRFSIAPLLQFLTQ